MKIFIKFLFASAILLFGFSCTNLDEDLVGDITSDINIDGVSTTGGTSGALSAVYASLRDAGTANHGGYYSIQEISSDEMAICAKGGDWFDGGILVELHRHSYTPTHAMVNGTWTQTYGAITTCNEAIANPDLDANQVAQARTLRAYYYWRLMDLYGNVKIVTTPGADAPQVTRQEVFDFVESELLDVLDISAVSSTMDPSGSALTTAVNSYQINQYAALGILSKVYLNAEVYTGTPKYSEAAMAAAYVMDAGVYTLCGVGCTVSNLGKRNGVPSDPDNLEGYAAVFAPNNTANPEHIFAVNYDEVTGGGMNFSQMNLHYSSQFTWNFDAQPWNGYATLEEFYNSYEDGDARKTASFIVGPQLDFGGSDILDYASDDGDLVLNYTPAINELVPNSLREAGARPGKFSFKQLGRDNMDNDFPIVRLGELYLNRAEGMARAAGDWNAGLAFVNELRARAGVSDYSSIDAGEFLAERGREMFQETSRRTDLIRFQKYNDAWWEKPADASDHVNLFPIPSDQITAATGEPLSQNPGY